ncbi:MAG: TetR/AcrR family transcriptional regulator [Anaerolineae bacterium]|nr:TetR/AcrR family transcriptional regulator [Anaerolineae bacterium]
MFDPSVDLKEQVVEHRRTQILLGAAKVFAEKGYHKATTKEIAQTAGVAEGTIYNYFNNKRELLLAMMELIATQSLKSLIADNPPADPKEFFTRILYDRYQLVEQRGYLIAPIFGEMFSDAELRQEVYRTIAMPIAAHIENYIQAHIDSGLFRPVDPVITTRMFVGAIIVNFAMKLAGLDPRYEDISADALIENLVSLFLATLLKPEPPAA